MRACADMLLRRHFWDCQSEAASLIQPALRRRRGVWMGVLLLWCAASIILPIIQAEGALRVFFPYLVRNPQVTPAARTSDPSAPDET